MRRIHIPVALTVAMLGLFTGRNLTSCAPAAVCGSDDVECLLGALVVEQDGQALELRDVDADDVARHYPTESAATELWAVGGYGAALHNVGGVWTHMNAGTTNFLLAVWGADPSHVWAVGQYDTIMFWDGGTWTQVDPPPVPPDYTNLSDVHGTSATDVWVVGEAGDTRHWDGAVWAHMVVGDGRALRSVYAIAPDDVWAVGERGLIAHWDGQAWSVAPPSTTANIDPAADLNDVWASGPDDVWAVGSLGQIVHMDGTTWSVARSDDGILYEALAGSGAADVWALGASLAHFDGDGWSTFPVAPLAVPHDVWARSADDAFAVGNNVAHWDGRAWNVVDAPTLDYAFFSVHGFGPKPTAVGGVGARLEDPVTLKVGEEPVEVEIPFVDPADCTPSFCFSLCDATRSDCTSSVRCTKAARDGSGTWRVDLGFQAEPAPGSEAGSFVLTVDVLSSPDCDADPVLLDPDVTLAGAGPVFDVEMPAAAPADTDSAIDTGCGGGGSGESDLCARYTSRCGDSDGQLETVGLSRPAECGCPPPSTYYQNEDNFSCGLPGEGTDCILCTCPVP